MDDNTSDTLIDVYPYTHFGNEVRFLIFKRSDHVIYAGQWRMIGGKTKEGETRTMAALRELEEETGCMPTLFWTLPAVNQFYEVSTDTIHHIAVFAACLDDRQIIRLNHEHVTYKWITIEDVKNFIKWPEQIRLLNLIHDILTNNGVMSEWRIKLP
ncbi:MAG: NUDIX domain-containing protein [Cyclonatronaceae bacterium]